MKHTVINNSNHAELGAESFQLEPDPEISNATSYSLDQLLQHHDRRFVLNAYAAIAKRQPDSREFTQTLRELRGGLRTKTAIVEDLVAKHPNVRVIGLSSPTIRGISRLPVIGYLVRVLRAVGRLPLLVAHQQQFEAYIIGQQQLLADHVDRVRVSGGASVSHMLTIPEDVDASVADAIKTVMMLSDSLIELSAVVAEGKQRLESLQTKQQNAESELCAAVQRVQQQQERSEAQLHADLIALTQKLTDQQQRLEEIRRAQELSAAAQREFLIDEQRAIVEAQRAAVSDLEEQLSQSSSQNSMRTEALATELRALRAALDELQQAVLRK